MIQAAAEERAYGCILVDGCGVGTYLSRLAENAALAVGLDIELERTLEARRKAPQAANPSMQVVNGAGEDLPFADASFDFVLSHEVLEHVQDDRLALQEIVRVLRTGGRLALFLPNRGYPFETHGIYWRGQYHFGNIPLVNYLPHCWRDRLAPHVRVYGRGELERLVEGLPLSVITRTVIFGAYDNLIARWGFFGRLLRAVLQALEHTPLRFLGLSHFWVLEKK